MTEELSVSVVIPTYKRAHLLSCVFEALTKQTNKNFDVVLVLKPSGDKSEDIVEKYKKLLKIKLIIQEEGYVTDAINLGLKNAGGSITAFLDDDAIPFPDWIQKIVETYNLPNIGGVAGDAIPAFLNERNMMLVSAGESEIVPGSEPFLYSVGQKIWSCPLKGLEDYFVYISKAGLVDYKYSLKNIASQRITRSLLGMGTNMSVLTDAIKGFELPHSWILGWGFEQFLGWHLWKKGYNVFYNPDARVSHLVHGQTLSRNTADSRRKLLLEAEIHLFFYRLYGLESGLSVMHRISWLIFRILFNTKQSQSFGEAYTLLKGVLIGNVMGCRLLASNRFGLGYDPFFEFKAMLEKEH